MKKNSTPLRFVFVMIAGLFLSELVTMGVIALFPNISYLVLSIMDATMMILLATPFLYYFSLRPLLNAIAERESEIVQRKQAEEILRDREQREHMLMQTIYTMQIDIARDLHDTIGQNIGYLRMKLAHLSGTSRLGSSDIKAEIKNMSRVANESYDLIRGTLAILQSEDSTDLSQLFERYALQIEERSSFDVEFSSQGTPRPISAKRMRQLFYVFREALSNIEKHANASHVVLNMQWEDEFLSLSIQDNGRGFKSEGIIFGGHYGLKFMRERVELLDGTLTVESEPGKGTSILLQLPYEIR